jgi:sarcosine oxidase gamma subunit
MVARRARTAPASRTGVATMVGLSPGDYLVAAVTAESPVDLRSVQSIEMLARQATRVTLAEGETRTQMLTVSTVR